MRNLLLCLIIFMGWTVTQAAPYFSFRKFLVENGLSHNTVRCGMQDSYGFLWFGTNDGLNCFNGSGNRVFRNASPYPLEDGCVLCLAEDENRNIWVGTTGGCFFYERQKGSFVPFDKLTRYGVSISCEVNSILIARDGKVWIGTLGQGFFIYDPQRDELHQNSRYSSFIGTFCQTETADVYVASMQNGLFCFDPEGNCRATGLLPKEQGAGINCLREVGHRLWMGIGDHSLCSLDLQTGQTTAIPLPTASMGKVRSLLDYDSQHLLVGTDNGLYFYDYGQQRFTRMDRANDSRGLSDVCINGLLRDAEGGIWILTEAGGVNYAPRHNKLFDYWLPGTENGSKTDNSRMTGPFCQDKQGRIWTGTHDGLYYQETEDGPLTEYPIDNSGRRYSISALWVEGDELWVGTDGDGLKRIRLKQHTVRNYTFQRDQPYSLCGNQVVSLYRTSQGELYVGTTYGLCCYLPETDNFRTVADIGFMMTVVTMHEDSLQRLWFGTAHNGIFRCDLTNRHWKNYQHRHNTPGTLASNSIATIFEDSRGTLWFGTNGGGLCRYDADTDAFIDFDPDNTLLPNRVIYAIEEDSEGYFWLSGDAGLIRIHPQTKEGYYQFMEKDGLQGNQFNRGSSLHSDSGRLYFGGNNGFNSFVPEGFNHNEYAPPVYLTGITLQHADEETTRRVLNLAKPLYLTKELTLPYTYNSFSLHFSALSYQEPDKNCYAYILHGVDKEWVSGPEANRAIYTNLPPGRYKFELRGANNDRKWTRHPLTTYIVIRPPWWRTMWAYGVYTLLACGLLAFGAWLWNGHVRRKYKQQMEEFRSQKEKEMYRSKISFFVNLVHEIRTPLSLISLPLETLMGRNRTDAAEQKYLGAIRRNVDYLLGVTNELLDFQKMESGQLTLKPVRLDMHELVTAVAEQFAETVWARGIRLEVSLPDTPVWATVDRDKVSKILVNLLGNALKYTRSSICIHLSLAGSNMEIEIDDDGQGLSDRDKKRVFQPFYQAENAQTASGAGTGLGLPFSRSLAEAHGGKLHLLDAPGGGCRALLVLPLESAALASIAQPEELLLPETEMQEEQPDESTPAPSEEAAGRRRCTLLLVEDNAELLRLTAEALRQWYKVIKACDGQQALELLEREAVDIIVSDVMMPGMDGFELCRRVKQDLNYSHIPLLLLTAKTTLGAKVEGMESGADAYIEKPFAIKQLHRQIENIFSLRLAFHRSMMKVAGTRPAASMTDTGEAVSSISQKDCEFIDRINQAIETQLADENFSIDNLAESLCMSRSNFYRKIKALTGTSPNDYLKTLRLNRAAEMLKRGDRISEVYASVGFSSSSYFAKCFKAQFGVLPKEYSQGEA